MKAKKTSFWLLLTVTNPDIVIGCESWLHPSIYEREVLPVNYHIVDRKDRSSDLHGGVLIAAKDTFIGTHLDKQTNTEFAAASFTCQGNAPLIIGSIYRPPNRGQDYMEDLCDKIRQPQTSNPRATLWISGDVNLPDIDWETHAFKGHNYRISINQCFLSTIYDTGSDQIVRFPTRGENILDVFLRNRPSLIEKCKAVPGVSDHDIVFVEASTRATRTKQPQRKIFLWKHVDIEEKKPDVLDFSPRITTQYSASTGVNELWNTLKHFTLSFIEDKVPSKMTSSRFSQPWINKKVKRISMRKKRAYKRAKHSCSISDLQRYRQLQKESQYECKKAYGSYVSDIVTSDKNSKKLYTFIKGKKCDISGISSLRKDGIAHSDPRTKATILNEQFSSVFTEETSVDMPAMSGRRFPDIHSFKVDQAGVYKLMQGLNPHKAEGPDQIPTRFLKEFATELSPAMTLIFQASLQQGEVPDDWKQANVAPIFKKGDCSTL